MRNTNAHDDGPRIFAYIRLYSLIFAYIGVYSPRILVAERRTRTSTRSTYTHRHSVPVLLNVRVIFFHRVSLREEDPPIPYYSPYIITIYFASQYGRIVRASEIPSDAISNHRVRTARIIRPARFKRQYKQTRSFHSRPSIYR